MKKKLHICSTLLKMCKDLLEQSGIGTEFLGNQSPLPPHVNISSKGMPGEISKPSRQSIWQNCPPSHLSQASAPFFWCIWFFGTLLYYFKMIIFANIKLQLIKGNIQI